MRLGGSPCRGDNNGAAHGRFKQPLLAPIQRLPAALQDIAACRRSAAEGATGGGRTPGGFPTDPATLDAGLLALSEEEFGKVKGRAYAAVDALMLTDAPLLHTPGQLALAACRSGLAKVGILFDPSASLLR